MSLYFKSSSTHDSVLSSPCYLIVLKLLSFFMLLNIMSGCVSEKVSAPAVISAYQESLAQKGPQQRTGTEGLQPISPTPDPRLPGLEESRDTTGKITMNLSLENAVLRALANSPEIKGESFNPSIAKESITVAAAEFDITAFGEIGYEEIDAPSNDILESGHSHSSLWETGIKKKGVTGAEWSLTYFRTRSFDESVNRKFTTSYEPTLKLELKQPLLRDGWMKINLAGVNISKLKYRKTLAAFRQQAEDVSTQVISLYWILLRTRRDVQIQQDLLDKTFETLNKLKDRTDIDATLGDIKQAEASAKNREASLFESERRLSDVQDRLVRLLADHQMNLIDDLEIVPTTVPDTKAVKLDKSELLELALKQNSAIMQAQLEVEVAEINVDVAKRQKMPRIDLVASTQLQGLSDDSSDATKILTNRDFNSYSVGVVLEYPLGNREKKTEFRLRELEHSKALSKMNNVLDQIATLVKEGIRSAETAHRNIRVHKDAVNAARIHLQSLEDIEIVRRKLTPEFLLAKIQAQDSLANAQRAEIEAVVNYNIALAKLASVVGTVLELRPVQSALTKIANLDQTQLNSVMYDIGTADLKPKEPSDEGQMPTIPEETEILTEEKRNPDKEQLLAQSVQTKVPIITISNQTKADRALDNTGSANLTPEEPPDTEQMPTTTEETKVLAEEHRAPVRVQPTAQEGEKSSKEYYVQVGAWKNIEYAQEILGELKKYYPEANIERHNNFNKIRIPGIKTKDQGAGISKDIEEKLNLKPVLVLKTQ